jgi:hypothetical protein
MKPVLIGMQNPLSVRPEHALFPYPPGCTGHRIFEMLRERRPDLRRQNYLDTFERRNLVVGDWDRDTARKSADLFYAEFWGSRRTIVLLGEEVRRAFCHPPLLLHPQDIGGSTWRQVPHPSGRNRWYNGSENRKAVGLLLEELYAAYHKEEVG